MKKNKLIFIAVVLFFANSIQAQFSVNIHVGSPPAWGPAGYSGVRYYYLPDVESYYDVQSSMFIYYDRGIWVHRAYLPARYRNYDLYGGYKVVMNDYRGNTPYTHFTEHRTRYARGYHREGQRTVSERPGKRNQGAKAFHEENHGNKEHEHANDKGNSHGGENDKKR